MTFISSSARGRDVIDRRASQNASYLAGTGGSVRSVETAKLDYLINRYEPESRLFWSIGRLGEGSIRVTPPLLHDVVATQEIVRRLHREQVASRQEPVQYFVSGSSVPGIYNLGGDLALFADCIRNQDRVVLNDYAQLCIDVVYSNHVAFDVPIVTIAMVQGDALGGGFENALSHDVLVAERSAKLGLPEVLFNLFPGMGAYSFLSRKLDPVRAEAMIMSGRMYTAEELHALGVVDVLAEDGEGELAVLDYVSRNARKFNAQQAMLRARRRVNTITEAELRDVVGIWVEAALQLGEADLRKMERLVTAQRRRVASLIPVPAVAAE